MNFSREDLKLYLVTDRRWLEGEDFIETLEEALKGGVTFLQLREKDLGYAEFLELAKKVKVLAQKYRVPFVVNDSVEIARAVDADGVHIGQGDMNFAKAREILGREKIIGLSCSNLEEARLAKAEGADYIGVGAVFPTDSKEDADKVGLEILRTIGEEVDIPIVGIGGINKDNIGDLKGMKVDGVSLISAILKSENKLEASRELLALVDEALYEKPNI